MPKRSLLPSLLGIHELATAAGACVDDHDLVGAEQRADYLAAADASEVAGRHRVSVRLRSGIEAFVWWMPGADHGGQGA